MRSDTSGINQIVNLQGIARNIEERVAAWKRDVKIRAVSVSKHHRCQRLKLVRV